ncbi:MAG: hypothetical protein M0Q92_13235 [Methanoregula sp.]|jgi:hypothetical protein|nr:hypothetical protein [Methanoregula sp.]
MDIRIPVQVFVQEPKGTTIKQRENEKFWSISHGTTARRDFPGLPGTGWQKGNAIPGRRVDKSGLSPAVMKARPKEGSCSRRPSRSTLGGVFFHPIDAN